MYMYVKTGYSDLLSMYSKTYYADMYDDTKTFALRKYPDDVELAYISEMHRLGARDLIELSSRN